MSLPHRRTTSAIALDELKRRNDLESLRRYLIMESCFPASKDPETSPITLEELKKLVRIWKLNERRNFWKTHSERDEIVSALIQHAEQNLNFTGKKNVLLNKDPPASNNVTSSPMKPVPPSDAKPSNVQVVTNIRNFCGLKYFNREVNTKELTISGRFFQFPDVKDRVDYVVDQWRSEDFDMKDELLNALNSSISNNSSNGYPSGSMNVNSMTNNSIRTATVSGIKNKVKIVKQRNLAMHLMNYSAHIDLKKTNFNMKTVQTFVTVAESDDPKTVSKCMIALSNISAEPSVRNILLEMNTMHKITNMLQYLKGKAAYWAASLLFYYFSCDKESEDRIYNACSVFLQVNGNSKDAQIRLVTLYTLNNLMPCIDRQRIAELILRILLAQFEPNIVFQDKHLTNTYLTIMQNMTWFTNAHATLLSLNILEMLDKFARFAVNQRNGEMGLAVAKILQSFLQLPEQAANIVGIDFIIVLTSLLESDQEICLIQALKAAVVLSNVATLRRLVHTTRLTKTIASMITGRSTISNSLAKEAAKYFCNITFTSPTGIGQVGQGITNPHHVPHHAAPNVAVLPSDEKIYAATMERLLEENIHEAVFSILKSSSPAVSAKSTAIRALQNIVSYPPNGLKLVAKCIDPMIRFLRDQPDLGAAYVLYNLACIPLCRNELVECKIHVKVLEFMTIVREPLLKSAYLQILVQLSGSNVCIVELLKMDLIHKLESQLKFVTGKNDVWRDISLMLLAVVAYTAHDLVESDQISITRILRQICVSGVNEDIIENCANVLKFISTRFSNFEEMDPVVRAILELGDNEEITDNVSTILYNMTCNLSNLPFMLKDSYYINVMIRIMRNGKVHVQENIAYAIRTLCSIDKCTELLLKFDIISDLIVIALLRTSSEEIKIVCSQAFYNMLCHTKSRLELLKGDLWWALMRLGRTDSQTVRSMCIRALSDLSYPLDSSFFISAGGSKLSAEDAKTLQLHKSCIQALRTHHVLSFMKDLSLASNPDSLLSCLQVVHNLLKQFAQFHDATAPSNQSSNHVNPYAVHEVIAAIRIAADAINRSSDIKCIRIATIVLLKCSQLIFSAAPSSSSSSAQVTQSMEANAMNAMVDNEFVNIDIVEVLRLSIQNWKFHSECRLNISRLLFELSKRKFFTKLVPLNDLNSILIHVYSLQNPKDNTIEILENVVGMLLQFIVSENVKPIEIIQLTIWPLVLKDSLSSSSSISAMSTASSSFSLSSLRAPTSTSGTAGSNPLNSPLLRGINNPSSNPAGLSLTNPANASGNNSGTNSHRNSVMGELTPPSANSAAKGRLSVYQKEATISNMETLDLLRGVIPIPFRIQGMALILLSYCIEEMLSLLQKYYQKNDGKLAINGTNQDNYLLREDESPREADREGTDLSDLQDNSSNNTTTPRKRKKKTTVKDNTDEKTIINNLLTIQFPSLTQGIIKNDFIDYLYTRNNLMHILHMISQFNTPVVESIFMPDTFQLLLRLLNNSVGSARYEKIQEYCSCILRNIAVNHNYLRAFIQIPHFQVINELISELCDLASTKIHLATDVSIFFYFLSDYLQTPTYQATTTGNVHVSKDESKILSPKFALDMINKLLTHQLPSNSTNAPSSSSNSKNISSSSNGNNLPTIPGNSNGVEGNGNEEYQLYLSRYYEMVNINKYTVSIILNKYTFINGVDPQFIQSMYSYLQTNSLVVIPNLMKDVTFKRLSDIKHTIYPEYLQIKEMMNTELLLFYKEDLNHFTPIVLNQYQQNDHIVLKLTNSKATIFDRLEPMDALAIVVFNKIVVTFEPTTEQQYDIQNNMISEENDEEDEKPLAGTDITQPSSVAPGLHSMMEMVNELKETDEEGNNDSDDDDHDANADDTNNDLSNKNQVEQSLSTDNEDRAGTIQGNQSGSVAVLPSSNHGSQRLINVIEEDKEYEEEYELEQKEIGTQSKGLIDLEQVISNDEFQAKSKSGSNSLTSFLNEGKDQATSLKSLPALATERTNTAASKVSEEDYSMNSFEEI